MGRASSTGTRGAGGAVDVRDMLCAQALAVVARAVERLAPGASVDILLNASDVRQDLLVWARAHRHRAQDISLSTLRLTRVGSHP